MEEEETSLCFCVLDEGRCRWYTVILNEEQSLPPGPNCPILCEIPSDRLARYFTCVSVGSKIYMIGGVYHPAYPSSDVHIVDVDLPDYRPYYTHLKGVPMIGGKAFPVSANVDGKIYVLGSSCGALIEEEPWAEVFDPRVSGGQWESLPDPPPEIYRLSSCSPSQHVLYEKYKKILVGYDRAGHTAFCFFDTVNNSWGGLFQMPNVRTFMSPGRHVIVNHHLYVFDRNLYVYDLAQMEHKSQPPVKVNGLEEATSSMFHPYDNSRKFLYHLGKQKLCLVWSVWCDVPERGLKIYCLIFRVRKKGDSLHAVVLHQGDQPYFIESGFELCDCLLVKFPSRGAAATPDPVVPDVPVSNSASEKESQDSSKMKNSSEEGFQDSSKMKGSSEEEFQESSKTKSEDVPVNKNAPESESPESEVKVDKVDIGTVVVTPLTVG